MSKFRLLWTLAAIALVVTACAQPAQAPAAPAAPKAAEATAAPAATKAPEPTKAPSLSVGPLKNVPRNQTLHLAWSISSPIGVTNPWASPGYTHQEANAMMWEGLSYYLIYANKELPWLAESMTYTKPDFTELTIKVRKEAKWSDGTPLTAKDVVFTFEGQMKNEKLPYHAQFQTFVKEVKLVDDFTAVVVFNMPAPRFKFEVLTLKFDTGIPIVPAHILSKEADVNAFLGGLEMPHSGPYNTVVWEDPRSARGLVGRQGRPRLRARCQTDRDDQHRRPGGPEHGHGGSARREQRI
jgi:peptide/nickel transport system substrate-binding protein